MVSIQSDSPAAGHVGVETARAVDAIVDSESARLVDVFKDLHRNPELGFSEHRTAAILAEALQGLGFDVTTGIGGTGLAAVMRNGDGPVVMYRADMDANAVGEETGLDYASTVRATRADGAEVPVGHMCGHDAHVTWMIGMATAMAGLRDRWAGTLILIGQPAEELIMGARAMVDDGLYQSIPKPDRLVALHTGPLPIGMVVASPGPKLAGTDQLDVCFRGVGGHGSMPQLTIDPVVMAATAVMEYQTIVSRRVPPSETAVLTVGAINAGTDNNVIPTSALLKLNLRWYNPAVRDTMMSAIRQISDAIARGSGVSDDQLPSIVTKGGSTPLVNDKQQTERLARALAGVLGDGAVVTDFPPVTGSEDAHLLKGTHDDIEFSYLIVGIADPAVCAAAAARGQLIPYSMHTPAYVVDLAAIPFGTKIACYAMLELLSPGSGVRQS